MEKRKLFNLSDIPVKNVVIHISLSMEKASKKLSQVRVIWLVIEPQ